MEKDFFRNVSSLDWDRNDFYSVRVFDPYVNKAFGKRRKNVKIALNYLNSFKLPISVGLIIKLSVFVDKVKFFNESLGVGTAIGSGEETEVVLKLLKHKCSGEYNGYINVYHEVYQVDNAFISKTEKYAVGQGYCLRQFSKQFSSILWLVFIELLIRSFGGYLLLSGNKSKMYKSRFKSLLKGALGRYIL
ncbi:hypothetical protein [Shewanella algae]|uniref:hypothetical protein n=1 Tax=Shewanella algae TaxID=38313 RepID=UPI001AAFA206|nr:hypothetical protein [Shewanella algae]MBO2550344.1 hypothetical protein [Shewanella algae]